jgi:hypothetical protein
MSSRFRVVALLLALVLLGGPAWAQLRHIALSGSFDGYDFLLLNDSVQKEIKLSDEQTLRAKEIIRAVRLKHRAEMEEYRKLPPPQGSEKLMEAMDALSRETLEKLTGVLQPEQIKRIKQIKVQSDGLRAFLRSDVVKELNLTNEQKEQIGKIQEELNQECQQAFQVGARGNYQEALDRMAKHRREAVQKAVKQLSAGQTKVWKELTGEPFQIKYDSPVLRRAAEEAKKQSQRK